MSNFDSSFTEKETSVSSNEIERVFKLFTEPIPNLLDSVIKILENLSLESKKKIVPRQLKDKLYTIVLHEGDVPGALTDISMGFVDFEQVSKNEIISQKLSLVSHSGKVALGVMLEIPLEIEKPVQQLELICFY